MSAAPSPFPQSKFPSLDVEGLGAWDRFRPAGFVIRRHTTCPSAQASCGVRAAREETPNCDRRSNCSSARGEPGFSRAQEQIKLQGKPLTSTVESLAP